MSEEKIADKAVAENEPAKIIFENPNGRKKSVRRIELVVSAGLWALFIYLLQFFCSSLFWGLAAYFVYGEVFNDKNQRGTIELLIFTFFFAILVFILLFAWASWNRFKYGGLDRRKLRPMPSEAEIAAMHHVSPEQFHLAQSLKVMDVLYTEEVFDIQRRQSLPDTTNRTAASL